MNRTRIFLYNSVSSGVLQLVQMLSGLILPRVILSVYGSEINGLVSSISQFISYFNLVEAGISGAAIYALYKPIADKDVSGINGIVSAAKHFYTQAGFLFTFLTTALAVIYPLYIGTNQLSQIEVGVLVLVLGINGALEFFTMAKYRVLLTADQKTYIISLVSVIHLLLYTAINYVLAKLQVNIVLVRFIALFSIYLRSLLLYLYCKRQYTFLNYRVTPNTAALNKRWDALYLQILGVVQTGLPVVLLTVLLKDLKLVSVYSIYNMVIMGVNGILSVFMSGSAASFGQIIAKNEQKTLKKAYSEFEFSYYLLITSVYATTLVTLQSFVDIYTRGITDTYYNLPLVGILFVINGVLYSIKTPQGMLVVSAGLFKETRKQTTVQSLILVILGVVLTPNLGIVGVLIASISSNLYRAIDLLFFIPRNVTRTKVSVSLLRMLRVGACVVICDLFISLFGRTPTTFFQWVLFATLASIISVAICFVIYHLTDMKESFNVIRRLKRLFGKKSR